MPNSLCKLIDRKRRGQVTGWLRAVVATLTGEHERQQHFLREARDKTPSRVGLGVYRFRSDRDFLRVSGSGYR